MNTLLHWLAIGRLSIPSGSCVRQTEALFERWGFWSLWVVRFVPRLATLDAADGIDAWIAAGLSVERQAGA